MLGLTSTKESLKLDRLKKRSDFLCVQSKGKKWVSKGLIVIAKPNDGLGLRFGVTATKKLSKKAVDRNRAKRRMRSVANDVLPLHSADNMDYVLIGKRETFSRPYKDLLKDLKWCLKRLDCLEQEDDSA